MPANKVADRLLSSGEPSVRWKTLVHVLGENPESKSAVALGNEVRASPRVLKLLGGRDASGRMVRGRGPYSKWQGAHWALAHLADIGYPRGDQSLAPMRDQVLEAWLDEEFFTEFETDDKARVYGRHGVPLMRGRYRRCGSQQGNALFMTLALGLDDGRCARLVERLLHWQWPDGGWNCDKDPSAATSSFTETLLPLRGLSLYAQATGDPSARKAALRAAEVFLERRLFRRRSGGNIIKQEFTKLHYPLYWHYDILGGLKAMAEAGLIGDPRCADALDLLESKRLADGGWPAEAKYYHVSDAVELGAEMVDWGETSSRVMNEWVTVDALSVLRAAGRA
jgi:hypothetical protein